MTWAQENVRIHLLTETMSTSYTHLNMCLSHFSSQQIGLGLERRTYYVAQNFFFWGGGWLGVWEFCRLSLVPQKKQKQKQKNHCRNFTPSVKVKTHINHQFVLLIVRLSWVVLVRGRFRSINWVDSKNWPPWRVLKLMFQISPTNTAPQFL